MFIVHSGNTYKHGLGFCLTGLFIFPYPVSTIDIINWFRDFQQLARSTDNCLHYLLLDMHDSIITNRLRSANKFSLIFAKTNKFKNLFVCCGLSQLTV